MLASVVTRKAGYKATQHDKYSLTTPKIIERIGECLIWIIYNNELWWHGWYGNNQWLRALNQFKEALWREKDIHICWTYIVGDQSIWTMSTSCECWSQESLHLISNQ